MADHTDFPTITPPGGLPKINSIFDFSAESLGQLRLWLEQNPPAISISNILGFSQFTAQVGATISTAETTTSTSYVDLSTVGPVLTNIPDGKYMIVFGAAAKNSVGAGTGSLMSVQANSRAIGSDEHATCESTNFVSVSRVLFLSLSNGGNNSLTAKYKVSGASTGSWANRWMSALRYSNL